MKLTYFQIGKQLFVYVSKIFSKLRYFLILRKSEVPTMLVELGYLSNEKDKSYLENKDNQIEIAQNILNFVANLKS